MTSCLQSRRSPTELQPHSFKVYNRLFSALTTKFQCPHRYSLSFSLANSYTSSLDDGFMHKSFKNILIFAIPLLLSTHIACGSDGAGDSADSAPVGFQQVMDIDTVFTPDDLDKIGFKKSRSYKLEGLPGASAAIFGFWRIASGDPIDYEVRFYESHADAVELGTALADEGSGKDAVLDPDDAQYKEGVKDRRMIVGSGVGGGARSGTGPRYGGYAIYGNITMLCGGAAGEQALDRCEELADALTEAAGQ